MATDSAAMASRRTRSNVLFHIPFGLTAIAAQGCATVTNLVARVAYRRVGTPAAANLRVGFHNEDHCSAYGGILLCGNIAQSSRAIRRGAFFGRVLPFARSNCRLCELSALLVLETHNFVFLVAMEELLRRADRLSGLFVVCCARRGCFARTPASLRAVST